MRYRVVVRVRPLFGAEVRSQSVVEVLGEAKLRVLRDSRNPLLLKFDQVLGPESSQSDVFESVREIVLAATEGQSGTILAYGQTGSGKTHTMSGDVSKLNIAVPDHIGASPLSECRGIAPRTLRQLFDIVAAQSHILWRICVCFLEIYNEKVYDLLAEPRPGPGEACAWDRSGRGTIEEGRLDVRESADGAMWVPGATMVEVCSREQAQDVLHIGTLSRTIGDNGVNPMSSRSHAIFQISLQRQLPRGIDGSMLQTTKLNLVDLAGSEKFHSDISIAGQWLQELTCINHSLSTLGQCISALVERRTHVPCRNSKLTRLLQDSLKGSSLTAMCICISPSSTALEETLSSLRFADRAKRAVIERPVPPTSNASGTGSKCQVAALMAQVRDLKDRLTTERHERQRLQHILSVADTIDSSTDRNELQSRRALSLSPGSCDTAATTEEFTRAASAPPKQRCAVPPCPRYGYHKEAEAHNMTRCQLLALQDDVTSPRTAACDMLSCPIDLSLLAASCDEMSSLRGSDRYGPPSAPTSARPPMNLREPDRESVGTKEYTQQAKSLQETQAVQPDVARHEPLLDTIPCHADNAGHPIGCSEGDVYLGVCNPCSDAPQHGNNSVPNEVRSIGSSSFETCLSDSNLQISREDNSGLPRGTIESSKSSMKKRDPRPGELQASEDLLWPDENVSGSRSRNDDQLDEEGLDRLRVAALDPDLSASDLRHLIVETLGDSVAFVERKTPRKVVPDHGSSFAAEMSSCTSLQSLSGLTHESAFKRSHSPKDHIPTETSPADDTLELPRGRASSSQTLAQKVAKDWPESKCRSAHAPSTTDLNLQCKRTSTIGKDIGAEIGPCDRSGPSGTKANSNTCGQNGVVYFGVSHPCGDKAFNVIHQYSHDSQNNFQEQSRLATSQISTLAREHDSSLPGGGSVLETLKLVPGRNAKPVRRWKKAGRNVDACNADLPFYESAERQNCNALSAPFKTKGRSDTHALTSVNYGINGRAPKTSSGKVRSPIQVCRTVRQEPNMVVSLRSKPCIPSDAMHLLQDSHQSDLPKWSRHTSGVVIPPFVCQSGGSESSVLPNQRIPPGSNLKGATAARAGEQLRRQKELLRRGREDRARRRSEEREGITDSSAERLQEIISKSRVARSGIDSLTDSSTERLQAFISRANPGRTRSPEASDIASHCWSNFEGALRRASPRQDWQSPDCE